MESDEVAAKTDFLNYCSTLLKESSGLLTTYVTPITTHVTTAADMKTVTMENVSSLNVKTEIYASLHDNLDSSPLPDVSLLTEASFSDDSLFHDSCFPEDKKSVSSKFASKHGKEDKTCAVCGDRALGCNFDAISCESCKAFFRRNAFKQKIKCLFKGSCEINVNTRRFCPYCRLKRCLDVGMKKDLILDVDEKKRRMEKVNQNRKKRQIKTHPDDSSPSASSCASPPATPRLQTPPHNGSTLQPENTNLLTLSRLMAGNYHGDALSSTITSSSTIIDSLLVRRLTAEESHMIQELDQVYNLSFTVDLEPLIHITQLNPSVNQLVNQSSITVLRLIKFAKRLDEFVRLSQESQIGILKGCWLNMLLLRSVSLYDAERDVWVTPRGDIPTEILKNATGYISLHEDHINYCKSIKLIIGNDLTIVTILLVLVLFAPEGPHVVSRELVSNIHDRYMILLKHYLEAKYTYLRSAEMYPQLLNKIRELNPLAEFHGRILLDVDPREIEPIMLEILDLK